MSRKIIAAHCTTEVRQPSQAARVRCVDKYGSLDCGGRVLPNHNPGACIPLDLFQIDRTDFAISPANAGNIIAIVIADHATILGQILLHGIGQILHTVELMLTIVRPPGISTLRRVNVRKSMATPITLVEIVLVTHGSQTT